MSGWVQLPDPLHSTGRCAPGQVSISGVSVASARQVWISGNARGQSRGNCPAVEEWNGHKWFSQPTTASNTESEIDYISVSGNDYWAEGWDNQAVVFHLVTGVWEEQPIQNDPEGNSYFNAIAVAGGHAFSVGSSNSGTTLIDVR